MKPTILRGRAATAEFREAFYYYLENVNLRQAQAFQRALEQAIDHIQNHPRACPPYLRNTRKWRLTGFPYSIIYRDLGESLHVVAFAHDSRDPKYWLERLEPGGD